MGWCYVGCSGCCGYIYQCCYIPFECDSGCLYFYSWKKNSVWVFWLFITVYVFDLLIPSSFSPGTYLVSRKRESIDGLNTVTAIIIDAALIFKFILLLLLWIWFFWTSFYDILYRLKGLSNVAYQNRSSCIRL